jgi:hypothetical protein
MDVEARVRQGVKAVLEEVLQEEMTEHELIKRIWRLPHNKMSPSVVAITTLGGCARKGYCWFIRLA